jgi:hypothetical protein
VALLDLLHPLEVGAGDLAERRLRASLDAERDVVAGWLRREANLTHVNVVVGICEFALLRP